MSRSVLHYLRVRQWLDEMTTSASVPDVIDARRVIKRPFANTLSDITDRLYKNANRLRKKKRKIKRLSKEFSPPLPPRL